MSCGRVACRLPLLQCLAAIASAAQMSSQEGVVELIADAIARYLQQHPDAADNVVGIQRWWLEPELAAVHMDYVQAALDQLQSAEVVVETNVKGGLVVYSSKRSKSRPRT